MNLLNNYLFILFFELMDFLVFLNLQQCVPRLTHRNYRNTQHADIKLLVVKNLYSHISIKFSYPKIKLKNSLSVLLKLFLICVIT